MTMIAKALCAVAASLTLVGAASAQSNALGAGSPGPLGATRDLSAAIANGYAPFSLAAFEQHVTQAEFQVTGRQVTDDKSAAALLVKAPNGMPFVFIFTDCGQQGCLFMEAVQPFAPAKIGVPISLADMNEYNRTSPLQVFMTKEEGNEVGLRWVLPALAGCGDACARSAVNLYFGAVISVYEAVGKASKQMVVEAPYEEEGEALDFAALAARAAPGMQADARWGPASAAFGDEAVASAAVELRAVAGRLSEELERAAERKRPAATDFPALFGQ